MFQNNIDIKKKLDVYNLSIIPKNCVVKFSRTDFEGLKFL